MAYVEYWDAQGATRLAILVCIGKDKWRRVRGELKFFPGLVTLKSVVRSSCAKQVQKKNTETGKLTDTQTKCKKCHGKGFITPKAHVPKDRIITIILRKGGPKRTLKEFLEREPAED